MARPRGNYAVTAARRQAILAAALEIFGESGYNGSSLKQVAEAVGMTEAGILHHFGSKSNLLVEVLQSRDDLSSDFLPPDVSNPLEFVTGWLKLVLYNISHPGIIELYTKVAAEATSESHPAHEHFKARYQFVQSFNLQYFDALHAGGHLRSQETSEGLSIALIALSDGLQVQWLMNKSIDLYDELARFFRSILTEEAWFSLELDPTRTLARS